MKILKYFVLLLVVVVAGIAIYGATRPSEYDVSRTQVINAPIDYVFNHINEFKNWNKWGPWLEEDPSIKPTYPEQTSGIGGSYSWTGEKSGNGSIKTVALTPNVSIDQKITFEDYEPSNVYWTFKEVPDGTEVTWGMKAENVPFMMKVGSIFAGGYDGMFGPMYEKGLKNMNAVISKEFKANPPKEEKVSYTIGEIASVDVPAQKFIGYLQKTTTDAVLEDMTKLYSEFLPKSFQYAMSQKLSPTDITPGAVFVKWDEKTKEAEFYIGVLLNKNIAPGDGMTAVDLPAGKAVKGSKYGPYGEGDYEAHTAINKYMAANNLTQNGSIWELYVNDPTTVKPSAIQTDIYYPVK